MDLHCFLDDVPSIDWSDLGRAHETTSRMLHMLASDRATLRALVLGVESDPQRLNMCELHSLDDKIVLYDALIERGFRIRLRLSTTYQDERPHNHRFSFTTFILRGHYQQIWYRADHDVTETGNTSSIVPVCVRHEPAGACFTIHHSTIHSTMTPPDTISLLVRGPVEKRRALFSHHESGRVWWRVGAIDETPERRAEVRMPIERYRHWCARLEACNVI
jgi:hypothetical protein